MDARLIYLVENWNDLDWITRKRIDLLRFWYINKRSTAALLVAVFALFPNTNS